MSENDFFTETNEKLGRDVCAQLAKILRGEVEFIAGEREVVIEEVARMLDEIAAGADPSFVLFGGSEFGPAKDKGWRNQMIVGMVTFLIEKEGMSRRAAERWIAQNKYGGKVGETAIRAVTKRSGEFPKPPCEPLRVCWRLQLLRGLEYEYTKTIFPRG